MVRDRNVRMSLQKTRQPIGQKVHGSAVVRDDPKRSDLATHKRLEIAKHAINVALNAKSSLPHDFAGRRYRHTLCRSREKRHPQT